MKKKRSRNVICHVVFGTGELKLPALVKYNNQEKCERWFKKKATLDIDHEKKREICVFACEFC